MNRQQTGPKGNYQQVFFCMSFLSFFRARVERVLCLINFSSVSIDRSSYFRASIIGRREQVNIYQFKLPLPSTDKFPNQ